MLKKKKLFKLDKTKKIKFYYKILLINNFIIKIKQKKKIGIQKQKNLIMKNKKIFPILKSK